jgi:1-acyl-sn-glycerol-3-phosphate acyltransferase
MLYPFAKILMTVIIRLFYRRIYATGLETIASKGPAIIIANHSSSLMDAALLGVLVNRPAWFFARADVFSGFLAKTVLSWLHMLPVHVYQAGRNTLQNNEHSFQKAEKILQQGGIIVFFPEGISHAGNRLKPFRKGVFRLAFQTALKNNFAVNIPIIPAGINYSHPTACFTDVMIHIGTPVLLNDYKEKYLAHPSLALSQITKDSYEALEKQVITIHDENLYELTDNLLRIKRNDYTYFTDQWLQGTRKKLEEEKKLCCRINLMAPASLEILKNKLSLYLALLSRHQIRDQVISRSNTGPGYQPLLLASCFPLFAIGYLLNCMPVLLAKRFTKTNVKRVDFHSWIFVLCAALFQFTWLLVLCLLFFTAGWEYALCCIVLAVFSGLLAHQYVQWWRMYRQSRSLADLRKKDPGKIKQIRELRAEIIALMPAG